VVEDVWDDVVGFELFGFDDCSDCLCCCDFYFMGDLKCMDVECFLKYIWKGEYVVDLVWVVGVVGCDYFDVVFDFFWYDFWDRVCYCEDDCLVGYVLDFVCVDCVGC